MSKPRKSLAQNLIWWSLLFLARSFRLMPHGVALSLGSAVATVVWSLSGRRVREAEARCARALRVGSSEARRIVRLSYVNLGRSLAEVLRFPVIKGKIEKLWKCTASRIWIAPLRSGKGLYSSRGTWATGARRRLFGLKGLSHKVVGAEQRRSPHRYAR